MSNMSNMSDNETITGLSVVGINELPQFTTLDGSEKFIISKKSDDGYETMFVSYNDFLTGLSSNLNIETLLSNALSI
jgi:hypothetical protein